MRPRILRLSASLLGMCALWLLLWSLLLSAAPVRSSVSPGNMPARPGVITDTRWLELIRSGAPGPQLNRSTAALPTLNLQLIDNLIAGRASSPALITIDARRDNNLIVSVSATPYPDGESYFYAAQLYPQYTLQGGRGGGYSILQPGDVILLAQGSASFTMTVPTLSAQIEAQADRVAGSAPVGGVVTTYLYSFANAAGPYTRTVSVDAGGRYQADYAGTLDVRPRDSGYTAYSAATVAVVRLTQCAYNQPGVASVPCQADRSQRSPMLDDAIERVLIDAGTIAAKVKHLAAQISATYQGVDELVMVCILNGAFRFTADLEEHLTVPYNIDFMSLSSYPTADTKSAGEVRVLLDVKNSLHSRHVLIVEDIIDTGHTLNYLYQMLGTKHPATLRSCALVSKTEVREVDVKVDWIGFHVPNEWLVGYGLDWHNKYRTLPYIGVLKPSVYRKR